MCGGLKLPPNRKTFTALRHLAVEHRESTRTGRDERVRLETRAPRLEHGDTDFTCVVVAEQRHAALWTELARGDECSRPNLPHHRFAALAEDEKRRREDVLFVEQRLVV